MSAKDIIPLRNMILRLDQMLREHCEETDERLSRLEKAIKSARQEVPPPSPPHAELPEQKPEKKTDKTPPKALGGIAR